MSKVSFVHMYHWNKILISFLTLQTEDVSTEARWNGIWWVTDTQRTIRITHQRFDQFLKDSWSVILSLSTSGGAGGRGVQGFRGGSSGGSWENEEKISGQLWHQLHCQQRTQIALYYLLLFLYNIILCFVFHSPIHCLLLEDMPAPWNTCTVRKNKSVNMVEQYNYTVVYSRACKKGVYSYPFLHLLASCYKYEKFRPPYFWNHTAYILKL